MNQNIVAMFAVLGFSVWSALLVNNSSKDLERVALAAVSTVKAPPEITTKSSGLSCVAINLNLCSSTNERFCPNQYYNDGPTNDDKDFIDKTWRPVRALQTFLIQAKYLKKRETIGNSIAYYGPNTNTAVFKFQKEYGIKGESGVVGPLTRAKLNSLTALSCGTGSILKVEKTNEAEGIASIKGSIVGANKNKIVKDWRLRITCPEGLVLNKNGSGDNLCGTTATTTKTDITDYKKDFLVLSASTTNSTASPLKLVLALDAFDSLGKLLRTTEKTINIKGGGSDINSGAFTVTYPTTGSKITLGQTYNITWRGTDEGVTSYEVKLLKGDTVVQTIGTVNASLKTLSWTVPTNNSDITAGPDYRIKFTGVPVVKGGSSGTFEIQPVGTSEASVSVNEPISGATVEKGKNIRATWQVSNLSATENYLRANLYTSADVLVPNTQRNIGKVLSNSAGDFNFAIPTSVSAGSYKIKVCDDKSSKCGVSGTLTVTDPIVYGFSVVKPADAQVSSSITISWTSTGIPATAQVLLQLKSLTSNTSRILTSPRVSNDGSEQVVIPGDVPVGKYKIKISSTVDGKEYSATSEEFNVTSLPEASAPAITSFSVDNSVIAVGETPKLSWSSTNASSCSAKNEKGQSISGIVSASGESFLSTTKDTTITLTCFNSNNFPSATKTVTIDVVSRYVRDVSFSINGKTDVPFSRSSGNVMNITWESNAGSTRAVNIYLVSGTSSYKIATGKNTLFNSLANDTQGKKYLASIPNSTYKVKVVVTAGDGVTKYSGVSDSSVQIAD